MPGEAVCLEGTRGPDGLLLLRSGTVELSMDGVQVAGFGRGGGV